MNKREENIYKNLEKQIEKIAKHNRQGSFQTKAKYETEMKGFAKFVAKEFGLQNLRNISDKHVDAYVKEMQRRELAPSTIKDRLSAIRFFHNKIDRAKHTISDNSVFGLERRRFGGIDRSWSHSEYKSFMKVCERLENHRMASIATLARNEGLRIHETLKISRSHVEKALREDALTVKGKGGLVRTVPLSAESREMLFQLVQDVDRGEKLFIRDGEKTHLVIKQCQNFINRHRKHFQDPDRNEDLRSANLTFHGLRHLYAQERYEEFVSQGMGEYHARLAVSELLGHGRDDVTRIYLAK